jgi:hypothetical protein
MRYNFHVDLSRFVQEDLTVTAVNKYKRRQANFIGEKSALKIFICGVFQVV